MRQQSEQSEQESPEQEALVNLFQNPDPPQEQPLYPPLSQISDIQQPSQTQILSLRNYNPLSVPPQFSTEISTHHSPQQSSSNTHYIAQNTNTVHFQTPTPPSSSEIQTST